jgi:hypothetical protein
MKEVNQVETLSRYIQSVGKSVGSLEISFRILPDAVV